MKTIFTQTRFSVPFLALVLWTQCVSAGAPALFSVPRRLPGGLIILPGKEKSGSEANWAAQTTSLLREHGFNGLGAWTDTEWYAKGADSGLANYFEQTTRRTSL